MPTIVHFSNSGGGSEILPSGGLTGQTLIKNSDTDYDASWKSINELNKITTYYDNTYTDILNTALDGTIFSYIDTSNNASLYNIVGGDSVYVIQMFHGPIASDSPRIQIASSVMTNKTAVRFYSGAWQDWAEVYTTTSIIPTLNVAPGTFGGIMKVPSDQQYTDGHLRNTFLSTALPQTSQGSDGDVWLTYI